MTRARVSFTLDTDKRIVLARYIGELESAQALNSSLGQLSDIAEPWAYDHVLDMRRFEGFFLSQELEATAAAWHTMAQGRDAGRLSAVISTDPLSHARLSMMRACYPGRTIEIFAHLDEGLDWIKAQREYGARAKAV